MNYFYVIAGIVMLLIGIYAISGGSRVAVSKKLMLGLRRGRGGEFWPYHYGTEIQSTSDKKDVIWLGCTYLFIGILFTSLGAFFFLVGINLIQFR